MSFQKPTKIRSKKLTRSAQGKSCTLRTPACNGDPSTVVFCHAPSPLKGMRTKSDDFWGARGCSACHAWTEKYREKALPYWMTGIFWTHKDWWDEGLITVEPPD